MVSLKVPEGDKQEDFILITDEDALLILVNLANQLAMNHIREEVYIEPEEDEDLLPPMP